MEELTIKDIAREAGVSKATVSRVLNKSNSVAPQTRERILEIIKQRKYSPSQIARGLSKKTSSAIGIVIPEVDNPFFGEILKTISDILDKNGFSLMCCNTRDIPAKDYEAFRMLKENRVRGLLYTPAIDYQDKVGKRKLNKLLEDIATPVVVMDRRIKLKADGVFFDDRQGMYDATMALIAAGHSKIGIINGSLDRILAKDRQDGYLEALSHAGIKPDERYMFLENYSLEWSYKVSKSMLSMEDRPTAVLTCNNNLSLGFLKALYERGETVEKDVACVGLDKIESLDIIGMNFNYIQRDAHKMAKKAVELLLRRMEHPDEAFTNVIFEAPVVCKYLKNIKE